EQGGSSCGDGGAGLGSNVHDDLLDVYLTTTPWASRDASITEQHNERKYRMPVRSWWLRGGSQAPAI
ncbi:MAG TPA: hypothetical protein VN890_10030, partial [Methylocella sp.]|nr:hypothetical protein [Methylocella sp.]